MDLDCSKEGNEHFCDGKFKTSSYPIIRFFPFGDDKLKKYSKNRRFTRSEDFEDIEDEIESDIGDETTHVSSSSMHHYLDSSIRK